MSSKNDLPTEISLDKLIYVWKEEEMEKESLEFKFEQVNLFIDQDSSGIININDFHNSKI